MLPPEQMAIINAHAAAMGGVASQLPGSLPSPNDMLSFGQPTASQKPSMLGQSNVRSFDPVNNVFAPAPQIAGATGQFGAPVVSDASYRGPNGKGAIPPQPPSTRRTVPGPKSQPPGAQRPAQIPAPRVNPKRIAIPPSVRGNIQRNQPLGGYASQAQLEAAAQADVNRQIAMSKNPYRTPGDIAWTSDPGFYGQSAVPDAITGSRNYTGAPVNLKRQSGWQDTKQFFTTLGGQIQGSPFWRFLGDLATTQPHTGLDPAGKAFAGRSYTMQDSARAAQGVKDGKAAYQSVKNLAVSTGRGIAQPFIPLAHRLAYSLIANDPYYRNHRAEQAQILDTLKTDEDHDPKPIDSFLEAVPFGSASSTKMFLGAGAKLLFNDKSGIADMAAASDQFNAEGLADPGGRLTTLATVMLPFALHGVTVLGRNAAAFDAVGNTAEANTARAGQKAFADHIKMIAQSSPEAEQLVHDAIKKRPDRMGSGVVQKPSSQTHPPENIPKNTNSMTIKAPAKAGAFSAKDIKQSAVAPIPRTSKASAPGTLKPNTTSARSTNTTTATEPKLVAKVTEPTMALTQKNPIPYPLSKSKAASSEQRGGGPKVKPSRRFGGPIPVFEGPILTPPPKIKKVEIPSLSTELDSSGTRNKSPDLRATLGKSTSKYYRTTYFNEHPELKGKVWVHHAVPKKALKYGVITEEELHSLENLRGIPMGHNSKLHLSTIRMEWERFYETHPTATREELLEKATEVDRKYGHYFWPPR